MKTFIIIYLNKIIVTGIMQHKTKFLYIIVHVYQLQITSDLVFSSVLHETRKYKIKIHSYHVPFHSFPISKDLFSTNKHISQARGFKVILNQVK